MKKMNIIQTYYEKNMGKGLPDHSVLGWESREAQRLRFDSLLSSVNPEGKKILDVGCGMGNLLEYILEKGHRVSYTGTDILQGMIESAEAKKLDADFYCVDIFKNNPFELGSFDIVYASGIFNLNLGNNREFLLKAIELFLALSRDVVAFNLLHHHSPDKEEEYYYFSPEEVLGMLEKYSGRIRKVNVIGNYLQNDFTVICHKRK